MILEACSAGVPVVAFPTGGIPEVIDHGRTGFLAESVGDMAMLALTLLSNPRAGITEAAHARWSNEFTLERYRLQTLKALTQSI